MNFARFEPWSLLDLASHTAANRRNERRFARDGSTPAEDWMPAVDIIEDEDRFVIRADVPGVEPTDIDVSMDSGMLSISGQRGAAADTDASAKRRIERSTGRFARRFNLPDGADTDGITARCNNGILEVVIPKVPEIPARRITVRAA